MARHRSPHHTHVAPHKSQSIFDRGSGVNPYASLQSPPLTTPAMVVEQEFAALQTPQYPVFDKDVLSGLNGPKSSWEFAFFTPAQKASIPDYILKMDNRKFGPGIHNLPFRPMDSTHKVKSALAPRESGRNKTGKIDYDAQGKEVYNRGRAQGGYQLMPENINPWARELGPSMYSNLLKGLGASTITTLAYRKHPNVQELIVTNHIKLALEAGQTRQYVIHSHIGWGVSDGNMTSEAYTAEAMGRIAKLEKGAVPRRSHADMKTKLHPSGSVGQVSTTSPTSPRATHSAHQAAKTVRSEKRAVLSSLTPTM